MAWKFNHLGCRLWLERLMPPALQAANRAERPCGHSSGNCRNAPLRGSDRARAARQGSGVRGLTASSWLSNSIRIKCSGSYFSTCSLNCDFVFEHLHASEIRPAIDAHDGRAASEGARIPTLMTACAPSHAMASTGHTNTEVLPAQRASALRMLSSS